MAEPIVVWRYTDGKAGHENQTAGLLDALRARFAVDDYTLEAQACHPLLPALMAGRAPFAATLPDPDLHIACGRATHLPMLAGRRARGGRAVVLSYPWLPLRLFDLCILPAHDKPPERDNVLVSQGVLNRVRNSREHDAARGLILIGGPSAHVDWSDTEVLNQVVEVVEGNPGIDWQLTSSRRTPADFMQALLLRAPANLTVVPVEATGPEWLPRQLARAGQVWVTEESVSMVYEALTSGAAVGLLAVPFRKRKHRLARGIAELVQQRLLTHIADWRAGLVLQPPGKKFDEAARCADWIAGHWLRAG